MSESKVPYEFAQEYNRIFMFGLRSGIKSIRKYLESGIQIDEECLEWIEAAWSKKMVEITEEFKE